MKVELISIIILLSVDISEVSPSFGSIAGGTVLTVKGKGFDERATKVSVEVAGNTLIILSLQYIQYTIRTTWIAIS